MAFLCKLHLPGAWRENNERYKNVHKIGIESSSDCNMECSTAVKGVPCSFILVGFGSDDGICTSCTVLKKRKLTARDLSGRPLDILGGTVV